MFNLNTRTMFVIALIWALLVVLVLEAVEAPLLPHEVGGGRPHRLGLERPMHAFVPAVLLRFARLNSLEANA